MVCKQSYPQPTRVWRLRQSVVLLRALPRLWTVHRGCLHLISCPASERYVVAADGPDTALLRHILIGSVQRHWFFFTVLSLTDTPLPVAAVVHSVIRVGIFWGTLGTVLFFSEGEDLFGKTLKA